MVRDQTRTGKEEGADDEVDEGPAPEYFIDREGPEAASRSLALLVAARRCYSCTQADEKELPAPSDVRPNIRRIREHCALASDYLLQDTPLKEAIFRVLLAGGNRPMNAEGISQALSDRWAMTSYPRDVSPRVIQRLLERSGAYCISAVPQAADGDGDD